MSGSGIKAKGLQRPGARSRNNSSSDSPKTPTSASVNAEKDKLRKDLKVKLGDSDPYSVLPLEVSKPDTHTFPKEHRDLTKCPCGTSNTSSWKIDCSKCKQEWHANCLSMNGIPKPAINLMVDWLCPFCYVAPVATNTTNSEHFSKFCYHCRNTLTLQQSNSDFEAAAAAENLRSLQTLVKSLASIDTDKLSNSLQLVQNLDLHLQHLLVNDQGLEKFKTLPDQIASAVSTKIKDNTSIPDSPALTNQISILQDQIQALTTSPQPDQLAPTATNELLEKISIQLDQLCSNEQAVSTGISDLKHTISSISTATSPTTHALPASQSPPQPEPAPPEPIQHGLKAFSDSVPQFIDEHAETSLLEFMETLSFEEENGHSVASFGVPYSYIGAKSCLNRTPEMPEQLRPLLDKINSLQEELYYKQHPQMKRIKQPAPTINACLVNKYVGSESHLPQHSDNEVTIHPESSIFTLSLGQQCSIKFTERQTKEESHCICTSRSLYHMTRKSQDFFEHCIEPGSITDGTRFSLTFRSIDWRNKNSTCLAGDSNTGLLRFGTNKRGTFGELMPGQKFWAPKIQDIDPKLCCSYTNVILMCGINDVRHPSVNCSQDIHKLYHQLKLKVRQIKSLNPKCHIYTCPLLPTKDYELNKKVNCFNERIFNDLVKSNLGVQCVSGFGRFADNTGLLGRELSRSFDRYNNQDILHLNEAGSRVLASLLKRCIFLRIHGGVDKRRGSSRVNGVPYSHIAGNHHHRGGYGDR